MATDIPQGQKISMLEYHKFQVENLSQNFLSLRQVEWQVAFQAYAGYAAIVVGYNAIVSPPATPDRLFGWVSILASLFVFLVTLYASFRVQERMHNLRRLEEQHLSEVAKLAGADYVTPNSQPATTVSKPWKFWFKVHTKPIHGNWYGFGSQLAISFAWLAGIVMFVAHKTGLGKLVCG